jgi:wyosine [tRNA(Phe)-imidazoG37] synthetase (radical SAM superfamily)
MKICERGLNFIQVYNCKGDVRLCSWIKDRELGNLIDNTMVEIYHSDKAKELRKCLINGDYSHCVIDACPYLAMDDLDNHMLEIDEIPKYPSELYLAYENVCNYACTSCTLHRTMMENKGLDLEKYYSKIEERLQPLLPHIKKISANGCGEVFCSKHILDILANWKPLADPDEIEVDLESNGSLFDEKHWKQIENLGQYKLSVAISVMSFDEPIYQYLSGTKLPVSVVENNLRFIKSLREKGIVNYFEIATVVQEQNFRTMPAFVKECIEEFKPDYIRLRPYKPWGAQSPVESWFTDVRNPEHPYYREYKKVMSDPIFHHPTVHDWSGGRDSDERVPFPYKVVYDLSHYKWAIISEIYNNMDGIVDKIKCIYSGNDIVIWGIAEIGKTLLKELQGRGYNVPFIIDQNCKDEDYIGINIYTLNDAEKQNNNDFLVIITPLMYDTTIMNALNKSIFDNFVSVKDLISDKKLSDEMKGL